MCTTVVGEHKLCYNNYDFIESMNLKSDWPHTAMTSFMDDPLSHLNKFRIFLNSRILPPKSTISTNLQIS